MLVFHQTSRQILAFFPSLCGNEWLGLIFRPKIFRMSGLMPAIDSWALMAVFLPHCDMAGVPNLACLWRRWTFGGLFRAFSSCTMKSPRVGRWGRQVWVLVLFSSSFDSVRLLWKDESTGGKSKLVFSPAPLNSLQKNGGYWLQNRHATWTTIEWLETGAKNDCTTSHQGCGHYCQGC